MISGFLMHPRLKLRWLAIRYYWRKKAGNGRGSGAGIFEGARFREKRRETRNKRRETGENVLEVRKNP